MRASLEWVIEALEGLLMTQFNLHLSDKTLRPKDKASMWSAELPAKASTCWACALEFGRGDSSCLR